MRGSIVKRVSKQKDANGKPAPLYYVVYRVGGRQKWERVPAPTGRRFARRRDAEALLAKRLNEIHGGEFIEPRGG